MGSVSDGYLMAPVYLLDMPQLLFCYSRNIPLLGCSKPGFSGGSVSGLKYEQAHGSSARLTFWSCFSHPLVHHGSAQGRALPGESQGYATCRKWTVWDHLPSIHPPTLFGQGLHLHGPVLTYATIRVVGTGMRAAGMTHGLCPQAGSSCTLTPIPVTLSASCYLLGSSSITFPPSPMPESLEQASTVEKFHTLNWFIRCSAVYLCCLCVTVKSYLYHLHRISCLSGVLW